MIRIDQRSATPIYEQIKQGMVRFILEANLEKDSQLPSVRTLSRELSLNPNTVQRAYSDLESEGILYSRSGRGSFTACSASALRDLRSKDVFEKLDQSLFNLRRLHVSWQSIEEHIRDYQEKEGGVAQ